MNIPNGSRGNGRHVQDNDPTQTANTKELIKGTNQAGDEEQQVGQTKPIMR